MSVHDVIRVATFINDDIERALRDFGAYTYQDKGPADVMDLDSHEAQLDPLPTSEIVQVFQMVMAMRMSEPPDRDARTYLTSMVDYYAENRPDGALLWSDPLLSSYR